MATFLYARVSTAEQTLDHQRIQAEAAGFIFDHVIADHGVSGVAVKMRDRPEGKRLFDMLRAGDTLVVRWIDRLGRNYDDVTDTIREFIRRGVTVRTVINGMVFDGQPKDPMSAAVRDALVGFMAAMGEAQAEATKEAQRAGIAAARAKQGVEAIGSYRGRKPSFSAEHVALVQDMTGKNMGVAEIARTTGLSRQTVYRIKDDPVAAQAALAAWA
ncbi:recombinase family protein [Tianweitania sp. BSSL-BM11]|uniref:Recombinase family protein n=1 Tax=Tianweitania aestuarii TaxID=2814886 RepID=A0ABS5RY52_9HYPH|nr:recombinase family protein [Tianweitania aestuarii]MBS9721948.1 recombinase family protein [Tianweitania aestuarii]